MKKKLETLGFEFRDEESCFLDIFGTRIFINSISDSSYGTVNYDERIKVWNRSSSNLNIPESFVVLECVIRLLLKGYQPELIELERSWKSGRGKSGRLDVLLKNKDGSIFSMIECKTWGVEYEKERNNLLNDGGQLFAYAIQERTTSYLTLYSSKIDEEVTYQSEHINIQDLKGGNIEEMHFHWDKNFIIGSFFDEDASLFDFEGKELRKNDLKALDSDSGRGLFNSFAEILRRNSISDKSNAFNKIFNLFVCKIYDEDIHKPNEVLDFQWKSTDSYKDLSLRLKSLYKESINNYLNIPVEDQYFSEIAEFSFRDVYSEESFDDNFKVVKEIVELLQRYQIKYSSKHQFLGDFFEDLLNTGIKQESGQFFTPTVLARFISKSIPISQIIQSNIDEKNIEIIPKIIDFACGAGHFLTESLDEVGQYLSEVDTEQLTGQSLKKFLAIKDNYYWAKDYMYGIELDYRLAKTTKIAMFLNGDGEAKIINQNALKTGKEKEINEFDILLSNPPFSVKGFLKDLGERRAEFSFSNKLAIDNDNIECFFIERSHQILKPNGYMGLILPISILSNTEDSYHYARKLLLLGFDIKSIVELRDKTFRSTGTSAVIIFARKREDKEIYTAYKSFKEIISNEDPIYNEILEYLNIKKEDAREALLQINRVEISLQDELIHFINKFEDFLFSAFLYFLNRENKIYISFSGEKKDQEHFLGYRLPGGKGKEGISIYKDDHGNLDSRLYDETDSENQQKITYYIKNSFLNNYPTVDPILDEHLCLKDFNSLLEPQGNILKNPSGFFISKFINIESLSPYGDFIDEFDQKDLDLSELENSKKLKVINGISYSKDEEVPYPTKLKVITASNIDLSGHLDLLKKTIYLKDSYDISNDNERKPRKGDIIISLSSGSLNHLGKVAFVEEDIESFTGGFLAIYRFKDLNLAKAVYFRLMSTSFREFVSKLKGQNINNLGGKINDFSMKVPTDLDAFIAKADDLMT